MTEKNIHPELAKKLDEKKAEYEKVTAFAALLPLFEKEIIANELKADRYCRITDRRGQLHFAWGVNWQISAPTNYPAETHAEVGFVSVYINTISIFGEDCASFAHTELAKALPSIGVHFYDSWNSHFYFLPSEAEAGLNRLEAWYLETKSKCDAYLKQKRKEDLERQLKELS